MAGALKALGVTPRPVPPLDPRSTDLLAFLCDKADRDAAKRGPLQ